MIYFNGPKAYYSYAYGKSIDTDNYPKSQKYQCFDTFADFCYKNGLKVNLLCSQTGYAGDLYKLRYEKGYDKDFEFFYPKHAEQGDWIFWDQHVAMVWDVDLQNDRVLCLGQNQSGHPYVGLKWYKLSTALGCMRFKGWIKFMDGWVKEGKHWTYYKNGEKVTGWQYLSWSKGTNWFYFTKDGVMLTSWQELTWDHGKKRNWFYFDSNGGMVTGLRQLKWMDQWDYYYFDEKTGAMQTGIITLNLTFDSDGILRKGEKA